MKKFLARIFIFASLIVTMASFSACKAPEYQIAEYNNNNSPSIDFMQPWAFYNKSTSELTSHFDKLAEKGFNTIIIQSVAKYISGEPSVCYYQSQTEFPKSHPDFLQNVIYAAKANNIKVVAGICSDDYWWQGSQHNYNDETMQMLYAQETNCINELLHYDIDGLYYANEMYSNPYGYETQWAKHLNSLIDYIEKQNPQMPLWLSPFNSSAFNQSGNSKIEMWDRFFRLTNFRECDLFLLQDGFGNLPSSPNKTESRNVYNLNLRIRNCCLHSSKASFALNTEYFAKGGYASAARIKLQTHYANKLGNVIACFSYSHYFLL